LIEFKYPVLLLTYLPLFVVVLIDLIFAKRSDSFLNLSENLKSTLFEKIDFGKVRLKRILSVFSMATLIFAASGPQVGIRLSPVDRKGLDLVFCIDVSSSMRGTDIKPSRLGKSKFEISQMIKNLKGDRVAFIVLPDQATYICH